MRLLFIITALAFLSLNAQNTPKAALTAGSESLTAGPNRSQSITETLPEYSEAYYTPPRNEPILQQGSALTTTDKKNTSSRDMAILMAGILVATAIYFISKKDQGYRNFELTSPSLEHENEKELKKEMWDKLADEPDTGENQSEPA